MSVESDQLIWEGNLSTRFSLICVVGITGETGWSKEVGVNYEYI